MQQFIDYETSFDDLVENKAVLDAIYNCHFDHPSKVQVKILPVILASPPKNAVLQGQNGAGKTLAFAIGSLCKVDTSNPNIQIVILIHSREVITQTLNLFDQLTKNLSIKLKTMAPGMPPAPGPAHILLLTPGFLNKLNAAELEKVTCFVVDEADQQISEENRRNRLKYVIDNVIPPSAQKLFVSATYSDAAKFLIQGILDDVQEVFEDNPTITSTVEMFYVECQDHQREEIIMDLFSILTIQQTFIFATQISDVESIKVILGNRGFTVEIFHSKLAPDKRKKIFEDFRDGKIKVLVTSDVLSRGVDVPSVDLVINYSYPFLNKEFLFEEFKHRCGRAGRAGKPGKCLNFVINDDDKTTINKLKNIYQVNVERTRWSELRNKLQPKS